MKDIYKIIAHDIFQILIILSVFLVPCFYWPNHEPRLMKFLCFQTDIMILLAMSFLFTPKRTVDNHYPALFLILGFLNLFTHGMSDFVNVGLSFITFAVIGIYVISNHLGNDFIPIIKKAIVLLCLVNCLLFITQVFKLNIVFTILDHERPSGFMCYPASFAMLCAVSMILAWEWRKWLCFPIGICLFLSNEYSVILGLITAVSIGFKWRFNRHCLVLIIPVGVVLALFGWHYWHIIHDKLNLRLKYLYPVIQNVWARPLDGWGIGMYNRLPDSFFGFIRGNWSEMHCEPLDLFFSTGFIGIGCVALWVWSVQNMNILYKRIFIVIGVTSCFHSVFHFGDTLFLSILLYSLMEIQRNEQPATS